jgi:hypothetical protein
VREQSLPEHICELVNGADHGDHGTNAGQKRALEITARLGRQSAALDEQLGEITREKNRLKLEAAQFLRRHHNSPLCNFRHVDHSGRHLLMLDPCGHGREQSARERWTSENAFSRDERSDTLVATNSAGALEFVEGSADRDKADAGHLAKFFIRGKPIAWLEFVLLDHPLKKRHDLLVAELFAAIHAHLLRLIVPLSGC